MYRTVCILLLLLPIKSWAQNLLPNPGFEKKSECPEKPGQITLANYWFSANSGTPDYFNSCSLGMDYGTEFNKRGGQLPHSGKGYAGLQFYLMNRNEYYEYIETSLDTSLSAGQLYCITAWVSLGDAGYAFRQLGALFSMSEIKSPAPVKLKLPFTKLESGNYLLETDSWMCIHGIYKAKGGERFLTLGGYSPKDDFWNIRLRAATDSLFKSTYYFIDDVAIEAVGDSADCRCLQGK
jgi:hypothetical protein